ncbi:Sodium/potassium/calcium exchanger 3 [Fukomys damarensis]|uniref:Sodium/potassium/calcium exchanger 3 n=1 Tax=Fukomys damarensis TaxID=885580 RepID=A0A091DFK0_FUKDA|nr:Sodium/potassium/calcium exchanger 3 [Fukomys damarensis]
MLSAELDLMDLIGEDRKWMVGRKLMQTNDTLASDDAGLWSNKNCTEPGNSDASSQDIGDIFFNYG